MSWFLLAALLYPSVLKTEANLFKDDKWDRRVDLSDRRGYTWEKSKDGPFSDEEPVWKTTSQIPMSVFWRQDVKLKTGHRYLVGAWVRREKARVLLWSYGRTKKDKPYDKRVYLLGGFNSCLDRYLRPEIKAQLGGGGDEWRLLYRPIDVTEDLAGKVQFKFGIFMSTGSVEMSHPFLIDITGMNRIPLVAEHKGAPVKRLALELVGLRDLQWEKRFNSPVAEYGEVIADSDALRGFDNPKRIDGSLLSVAYSDGKVENVYAPQEGASLTH
jgi:hypothetical protein